MSAMMISKCRNGYIVEPAAPTPIGQQRLHLVWVFNTMDNHMLDTLKTAMAETAVDVKAELEGARSVLIDGVTP